MCFAQVVIPRQTFHLPTSSFPIATNVYIFFQTSYNISDVKNMSATEFIKEVANAQYAVADYLEVKENK
jgi:hypothetical protein